MANPTQIAERLEKLIKDSIRSGTQPGTIKQMAMMLEVTESEIKDGLTLLQRKERITVTRSTQTFGANPAVSAQIDVYIL